MSNAANKLKEQVLLLGNLDWKSLLNKIAAGMPRRNKAQTFIPGATPSSILLGYTKGFCDFMPQNTWQWFVREI